MQHPLQWSTRPPLGKGLFEVLLQEPFLHLSSTVLRTISPWGAPVCTCGPDVCAELSGCSSPPCRLSPRPQLGESRVSSSRQPGAQELMPLATGALGLLAGSVLEGATGDRASLRPAARHTVCGRPSPCSQRSVLCCSVSSTWQRSGRHLEEGLPFSQQHRCLWAGSRRLSLSFWVQSSAWGTTGVSHPTTSGLVHLPVR